MWVILLGDMGGYKDNLIKYNNIPLLFNEVIQLTEFI